MSDSLEIDFMHASGRIIVTDNFLKFVDFPKIMSDVIKEDGLMGRSLEHVAKNVSITWGTKQRLSLIFSLLSAQGAIIIVDESTKHWSGIGLEDEYKNLHHWVVVSWLHGRLRSIEIPSAKQIHLTLNHNDLISQQTDTIEGRNYIMNWMYVNGKCTAMTHQTR